MDHMVLYFIAGITIYQFLRWVGGLGIFARSSHGGTDKFLMLAGDSSYSIYLTHSFVLGPAARIWGTLLLPPTLAVVFVTAMLLATTSLGIVVHVWVEKPMLRLLKILLLKRQPAVRVSGG
jgi:peptidoglycan/LPS O-acetylase OafA/YrhL